MTAYTIIPSTSIDADSLADVALMTALRDNAIAIGESDLTAPAAARTGKLLAFTTFTITNLTWSPNAKTTKIVTLVVGGGSGGAGGYAWNGEAGHAGAQAWGVSTSISGTYAATIGAGSAGGASATASTAGTASSFIGTGISVTAAGGVLARSDSNSGLVNSFVYGFSGETGIGVGGAGTTGAGGAATANSGAGGAGGINSAAGGAGGSGVIFIWEYA